jgi:hypothetical protein
VNRAAIVAIAVVAGLAAGDALAHEERLLVGRVERIDPVRKLLVVADTQRSERRRIDIDADTEVIVCQTGVPLAAITAGALVRVKYIDRPGAQPEARSILLLGEARRGTGPQ